MLLEKAPSNFWIVCKFGGTSVANEKNWRFIQQITSERLEEGVRILMICSALKGVTDKLDELLRCATRGGNVHPLLKQLQNQHIQLGNQLGIHAGPLIQESLKQLGLTLAKLKSSGCPPHLRAKIMAEGEVMSSRLGAAFLKSKGMPLAWRDARELLISKQSKVSKSQSSHYLSAQVSTEPDEALVYHLNEGPRIVVTQGYIAGSSIGETLLLGRGGSDTSASYFAAKLQAKRLEIWTDVPGMFSANPHQVPGARLIHSLSYNEAEAMAQGGGKVLHPRCLAPVRTHSIPLHVKCTSQPTLTGTVIEDRPWKGESRFSAVSSRHGLYFIESGFSKGAPLAQLPRFSEAFAKRGLQVNALTLTHRALNAAIDPLISPINQKELANLLSELKDYAKTKIDTDVASLSLIGRGIDHIFHEVGPIFSSFGQTQVRQVSKNNDTEMNVLFSNVDMDELVHKIHSKMMHAGEASDFFGPTWEQIRQTSDGLPTQAILV